MVNGNVNAHVVCKVSTREQLKDIQTELQKQNPDLRVSYDYVLRQIINKWIGDLQ